MNDRGGVVCLWGRDVNGNLKGSCRSDGVIAIPDLFAATRESFIECGGHNASGGFSVSHERAHHLSDDLAHAVSLLLLDSPANESSNESLVHDADASLREISWSLLRDVARLAPFGIGNPKPVFRIARVTIAAMKHFGKEKNHVELTLSCPDTGASIRAFDFFRTSEDFSHVPTEGKLVSVLATLERDTFRYPARLALRLVDVLSA
jgi:single-stranded-DNA-specific exonuclease